MTSGRWPREKPSSRFAVRPFLHCDASPRAAARPFWRGYMRNGLQANAGFVLPRRWQHSGRRFVSQRLLGRRNERSNSAALVLD
jgi:hypothetical protein